MSDSGFNNSNKTMNAGKTKEANESSVQHNQSLVQFGAANKQVKHTVINILTKVHNESHEHCVLQ